MKTVLRMVLLSLAVCPLHAGADVDDRDIRRLEQELQRIERSIEQLPRRTPRENGNIAAYRELLENSRRLREMRNRKAADDERLALERQSLELERQRLELQREALENQLQAERLRSPDDNAEAGQNDRLRAAAEYFLDRNHPGWRQLIQRQDFIEWRDKQDPELLHRVRQLDLQALDALFNGFAEVQSNDDIASEELERQVRPEEEQRRATEHIARAKTEEEAPIAVEKVAQEAGRATAEQARIAAEQAEAARQVHLVAESAAAHEAAARRDFYTSLVSRRIRGNFTLPPNVDPGAGLECKVRVRVNLAGEIVSFVVESPSGNRYFDDAVSRAVKNSDPLPPLPDNSTLLDEFDGSVLELRFSFESDLL